MCTVGTITSVKRGTLSTEVGNDKKEFIMTTLLKYVYRKVLCHLNEVVKPFYEQKPPAPSDKDNSGEKDNPSGKDK